MITGLALLVTLQIPTSGVFPETKSPSGRYIISFERDPKNPEDDLAYHNFVYDLKLKKRLKLLKEVTGFPGQNHGGMDAAYSENDAFGLVDQEGKWEPRSLTLFVPANGPQLDVLGRVNLDAQKWTKGKYKKSEHMSFDVQGGKFVHHDLILAIVGQVPKDEDTPVAFFEQRYSVKVRAGKLVLGTPAFKRLTEATAWTWKK